MTPSPCPAGEFQAFPGQTNCTMCPRGAWCGEGATAPVLCHPGSFNPQHRRGSKGACLPCPIGRFCVRGAEEPLPCAAGRYGDAGNQTNAQCVGRCGRTQAPDVVCVRAAKELLKDGYSSGAGALRLWRGVGAVTIACVPAPVSYTHLTLPTKA